MSTTAKTVTIEVDRETADRLRAQARARGLSVDAYLRASRGGPKWLKRATTRV